MEFDVFVRQGKFSGDIERLVTQQGTVVSKPFSLEQASPTAKLVGKWVKDLIKITKDRLERSGINASNDLSQSIQIVPIDLSENKLTIGIEMNGYWKFVDLGVRGAKSSAKAPNSPFTYREKMPPPKALQEWIAFKGIPLQGNDKQAAAKNLSYYIARSIRDKGTKATRFFSDSLTEDMINVLVDNIATALGKEISVSTAL